MPIEPEIIDANVLVYALDADALSTQRHAPCLKLRVTRPQLFM
jgi:predicted nucleic acid-binding protein